MTPQEEKGFKPDFENRGFWEYYKDLERQFENFLVYVPYFEGNEDTYSFRLANILLAIGAHIDSALKKIAEDPSFSCKYPAMIKPIVKKGEHKGELRDQEVMDYYPISEEYILYEMNVVFKCLPKRENVLPFKEYRKELGKVPYWWTAYNHVKHFFSEDFKQANLRTVRDALAGAFLLNVIHEPAALQLFEYGLLKPIYPQGATFTQQLYDTFRGRDLIKTRPLNPDFKPIEDAFTIETPLFSFDYLEAKKLLEAQGKYRKHEPTQITK
jgi:hypothetical protein